MRYPETSPLESRSTQADFQAATNLKSAGTIPVTDPNRSALNAALTACAGASAGDRQLDAIIASAVFPALTSLPVLDTAVWRHEDGIRVRALRYSSSLSAATTLVPAGCWLEDGGNGIARVCGAEGEWEGIHSVGEIAICIGALKARIDVASSQA